MQFSMFAVLVVSLFFQPDTAKTGKGGNAFILKTGKWSNHPASSSLKVGPGTIIVVKNSSTAVQASGFFMEHAEGGAYVYDLMAPDGFVASLGAVTSSPSGSIATFGKPIGVNTITPPNGATPGLLLFQKCFVSGTFATARFITCDGKELPRTILSTSSDVIEHQLAATGLMRKSP